MKQEMSSVDIKYIVEELKSLEGARVDKIYHDGNQIRIKFHITGEGRKDLIIEAGKRIHLTTYIKEAPQQPSSFTMLLRKYLSGLRLESIEQYNFDRIVKLKIGDYTLIAELFRKGNVVLVDKDNIIISAMRYEEFKDRVIKPKHEYKLPPARENPVDISWEKFKELISSQEVETVRALARSLNMGGLYAEEILLKAGIEKTKKANELSEEELKNIFDKMKEVFNSPKKPNIVYKDDTPIDVLPIELKWYEGYEKKFFETFSGALDEYFGKITIEGAKLERTKKLQEKKKGLEITLKKQEEMIKGFEKQMQENQEIGDLIYANFTFVENLLRELSKAVENLGWEEFKKRIEEGKKSDNKVAQMIKNVDPKEKAVTIELEGKKVKLYLNKSIGENAEIYYEIAKKAKHKLEGARKAYEDTLKKIQEIEKLIEEEEKKELSVRKLEKRKKKWFEKFKWFLSSEGFLIIAGKDATTNEIVVKRYMSENDLYCHADIYGAPHVVIKDGKKAGEKTIFEACQFAVSMSRAWKEGLYSGDAYWTDPNQVTKKAPSGEYLGKGAFMVYGKRNWMHGLPVKLAVGIVQYEGEELPMCGPLEAVKAHADKYIIIRPGRMKKSEFAKRLTKILERWGYKVDLDELMQILPPGNSEIVEVIE
ncbi:ribosome rescue protein RqcH [Thermococcus sibiricus]|uniref:Archaeal Rqc2 homolog aRqcH n=1 Tax=Thermococcus sibiricus TaxID=172049 RepID=A0A101EMR3_9EURY|nr:ribosome rescue protein RqcH [Thermococcus sibiricus]KUK18148.1 MAG: Fibronectin-binding protein [Thermococcus sibiricus]